MRYAAALFLIRAVAVCGSDFPPEAVEEITRQAHLVAPEIGADALLRVAPSVPKGSRAELLELAFRMAGNARFPVEAEPVQSAKTDSRSWHLPHAYSLQMDAVSLKCRAVRLLLVIDPAKARELFGEIILPARECTCKEQVRPNYQTYYQTAGEVIARGFAPKEVEKNEPIWLLESLLRALKSPAQVEPAVKLVLKIHPPAAPLAVLVAALAAGLDSVIADDRSFGARPDLNARIVDLSKLCLQREISPEGIVRAYRRYLVRHYRGVRCADNVASGRDQVFAKAFNEQSGLRLPPYTSVEVPPLSPEEMQPEKIEEGSRDPAYWSSERARSLRAKVERVNAAQASPAAVAGILEILSELDRWKAEDEVSESDYFHQKSSILYDMLMRASHGDMERRIIANFVDFLNGSALQRESPAEWCTGLQLLLQQHGEDARRAFVRVGNPAMLLYSRVR